VVLLLLPEIFEIALNVSTPLALAAFAIACILYLIDRVLKHRGKITDKTHVLLSLSLFACLAVALIATIGELSLKYKAGQNYIYRVRITVVGAGHTPVENATVWTSIGGEPKKVNGGWEFDIPDGNKPPDGQIVIYAKISDSSLQGKANLRLDSDRNPTITVSLETDESAMVRGTVEDNFGHAISGVDVSVVGYGDEHITTSANGSFVLRAHVSDGQMVRLHAEARKYQPLDQDQPAGNSPAILILRGKHGNP
jgi:hypothetical protein